MVSLKMNDTEIKLLTLLNSYGDVIELDWEFDVPQILDQLQALDSNFITGPNGKHALNLTGDTKSIGVDSKDKHNADQEYTEHLHAIPQLRDFFDCWEKLARCRCIKIDAGGFFSLHRDAWRFNPQMRIFIPLNKTERHEWNFIYDTSLYDFKPGKAYVLNTRKQHGSFAFEGGIYHILMSLYLTEENIKSIHKLLPNTMGDKK